MQNLKNFKFVVIGLGSMGKRRIRNLLYHKIKTENIVGFDVRADRNKETTDKFGIKTYKTFKEAIRDFDPDVYIISCPADKHYIYFLHAAKNKKHLFVEHPVIEKGYKELIQLMDGSFVAAPSCTLRFHPAIKMLKKIFDEKRIGKIFFFQYHFGQYLPSWHPWEDYRSVYFSKKLTGACREMFGFELVWLEFALGLKNISEIAGFTEKLSDLKMAADDRYSALLKFGKEVSGNMVIELVSKKPFRTLRVTGSKGVLEWEWQENQIRIYTEDKVDNSSKRKWKIINLKEGKKEKNYVTTEEMYEEEIGFFLDAVRGGKKYPFSFKESLGHLKELFALEKSARTKKFVSLKNK